MNIKKASAELAVNVNATHPVHDELSACIESESVCAKHHHHGNSNTSTSQE